MRFRGILVAWLMTCLVPVGAAWAQQRIALGNFQGDARAEVFRPDGGSWWTFNFSGSSWTYLQLSTALLEDIHFADFDRDGKSDVFYANGSAWYVSYSGVTNWNYLASSRFVL